MDFGVIARKDGPRVRLYSRPGNDLTRRFPLIVETLGRLRSRSCIIDGEAVACDDNGVASFDLVRHHRANERIFLYAFDLIELNGDDLRRDPLEVRNATLASIVAKASPGIRFNEHLGGDGPTVFAHACKLGLEGIVSKRKDSAYRSGRSPDWLKIQDEESGLLGGEAGSGGGLGSGTLAIAGRPVRNIHRAQGVCSDGNPPQSLVRVLPRPRPTSLLNATHSGGVLVVDEPTQPGAAIRGRLEHSRLRRRYFSAALILHTKGR